MSAALAFHEVARLDVLDPEYPLCVFIGDHQVALFLFDGQVYATDNICTHAHASLVDGVVNGDTIECPLHGACFNFRTGAALTDPATIDLEIYPTRVEDGKVFVGFPE